MAGDRKKMNLAPMARNRYFELPEEIIQHIQSFLEPKEACRTSILSKLWYRSWSTHPILCLMETSCFMFHEARMFNRFQSFARRTIERYQTLNLKPNSFRLSVYNFDYHDLHELADELILAALNFGVKDLHTQERTRNSYTYSLPPQLFSSVCLEKLSICGSKIDLPQTTGRPRVLLSRLVSLVLSSVFVGGDDMMRDILLGCPLVENLVLDGLQGLEKVNLSVMHRNLKTFGAGGSILVEWEEKNASGTRVRRQYPNLISLELKWVRVDSVFFSRFSHRFPCLEKLTERRLEDEDGHKLENLEFRSNSLRDLVLLMEGLKSVRVNVPNARNFCSSLIGIRDFPSLSFSTSSAEWKSDLKFTYLGGHGTNNVCGWFLGIRNTLTMLSLSKISLVIDLSGGVRLGSTPLQWNPECLPFVESLKIVTYESDCCLITLFVWFWYCRPKFVTWQTKPTTTNEKPKTCYGTTKRLYNLLKKHHANKTSSLHSIHGLEEVDIEIYEEALRKWCPAPHKATEAAGGGGEIRLHLKWRALQA